MTWRYTANVFVTQNTAEFVRADVLLSQYWNVIICQNWTGSKHGQIKGVFFLSETGASWTLLCCGLCLLSWVLLVPKAPRAMPALYYSFILNQEAFCFHCSCFEMQMWRKKWPIWQYLGLCLTQRQNTTCSLSQHTSRSRWLCNSCEGVLPCNRWLSTLMSSPLFPQPFSAALPFLFFSRDFCSASILFHTHQSLPNKIHLFVLHHFHRSWI